MREFNQKNIRVNMNYLNEQVHHSEYSIRDLINGSLPQRLIDQEIVISAYRRELNSLLNIDNVYVLAKELLSLERKLIKLVKVVGVHISLPNLEKFYSSLSPVILQSLAQMNENFDQEDLTNTWLEAVRIAIEEELVSWQEKN